MNDDKPFDGHLDFFYQADEDKDEAMSPPSSPSDTDGEELVSALQQKSNTSATQETNHTPRRKPNAYSVTSMIRDSRRPSRADFTLQQAKQASSKGLVGYESFGSISLDFTINCGAMPLCCQYNYDGSHLATGLTNGVIKIYDANSPDFNHIYTLADEISFLPSQGVTAVRYLSSPAASAILISGYTSGHVKIWHISTSRALTTFTEGRETLNIAVDPLSSGSRLLTVGANPDIFLYDIVTKQKVSTFSPSVELNVMDGHRSKVFACQFHPQNPHVFYTGGWDNTVQFWDTREEKAVRSLFGPHLCGDAIDLDAEHNHLITGSWRTDEVLQIWDFASLKLIKTVDLPVKAKTQAYSAGWLGQQYIVFAGSSDNLAACIDRSSLNVSALMRNLPGGVYATTRHPNHAATGNRFVAVSDSFLVGLSVSV